MNEPSPLAGGTPTRDEKAAYRWALNMIDDPERYGPGLAKWLAGAPERAEIYDRVIGNVNDAGRAASRVGLVRPAPVGRPSSPVLPKAWLLAAAAAAAILAFSGFALLRFDRLQQATVASAGEHYSTRIGEVRTVRLSDNSRVILDTDSLLQVGFTQAERDVRLLRGRARFDVAHDAVRPFVVLAGSGSVTAVGTLFDVTIGRTVKVELLRGVVDVRAPRDAGASHGGSPVRLAPGEQTSFVVPSDTAGATALQADAPSPVRPSDAQWVTGTKAFDDVPLSDIVAEANRYSATRIEIADPEVASRQAFVELNIRDVAAVASELAELFHLDVDRSHPGLIVLRKPA